jgi:hypothetical protein
MAVMTLQNLVLRGVAVLQDGPAVLTRQGQGYRAVQQVPASYSKRRPSPRILRTVTEPNRARLADHTDERSAKRAGRPGCWAGVSVCRSLAPAGASRSGVRSALRKRGASLMAAGRIGPMMAEALATRAQANPGCAPTAAATNLRAALTWRASSQEGECRASLSDFSRAAGSSTTSTRGKGVR